MWGGSAVAIEKVRDAFATVKRSFQSVVEMWLALKHPNILQLFGGCSDEAGPFFVCEYAECGDLGKILRERGQEKRVWPKLLDVAFALRYLHARGIIHGDIRLQNILVCRDGKAKLAGFVLSSTKEQAANTHPEADQRTGCEWLKTTWSCGHHPSLTSDVYGLGQCILDAVNGDVVSIQHDEPMRCDICSNYSLPQQPATFSDDQWQLVSDMCCSNPQERITMAEVVYRLSRLVAVDTAIDADLKTLIELDSEQRNRVQAMVLKKVLEIEAEDEDDADTDNTCSADDDIRVATRKTLVNQQKVACRQTMDRFVADAAKEVIDGALEVMQQGMDVPTAETRWPKHAGIEKALMPVGGACFEWRIAPDRVEVAKNAGVLHGSVAKVQQGMWLGATVAVKKMKNVGPSDDQAFREEANIWYGLNHPHIVNLFGACTQGYQVFVSDFAEGGRLDYYLREGNNRVQVWGLLHEAALGLRWLHSRGVTHADLKCDNILVTADGRAKLADFGLSCVQECSGGKPVGALRWKAPECLRGSGPTFASDVYSFGMCILEAVSAKFPWGNKMADNVVSYRVGRGELPAKPTSGFDETRWQLVKRMCCPEPQNRLNLDFVVGALGLFANRSPCTEDAALRNELATWEEAR
ncbi:hypothetical protein BBJ28_00016332 [Nothophytophthora sp. Chile5]|nr:hypothetical protein BBJ28_00016332 [Nothophytophthora sp. Chile5]